MKIESVNILVCPYCNHEHMDAHEEGEDGEWECAECGKEFLYSLETIYKYKSWKASELTNNRPIAWIVKGCPNFYFLPSLKYDRIFTKFEDDGSKQYPEYWESVGFEVLSLVECKDEEAEYWLVDGSYGVFDAGSAEAAKHLGKTVIPCKIFLKEIL